MSAAGISEPALYGSVLYGYDSLVIQFVESRVRNTGFEKCSTLGVVRDGQIVAGVVYHNFKEYDVQMSIASDDAGWITPNVARHVFGYPFNQLGVTRITVTVARKNKRSRKLAEGMGFVLEGVARRGFDGKQDLMIYGMLREECRILNRNVKTENNAASTA